jgi:hypothetical protein
MKLLAALDVGSVDDGRRSQVGDELGRSDSAIGQVAVVPVGVGCGGR